MFATQEPLWKLSAEIIAMEDAISEIQDDPDLADTDKEAQTTALFERWISAGSDFNSKAEQVGAYIKYLEALTEARKAEYRRLRELAQSSETKQERLKAYLVSQMEKLGTRRIDGAKVRLSLRKKPPRVCLNGDPQDLPPEFQKITIEPRLAALKEHLKANPECPFAWLSETQENSLIIK